MLIDWRPSLLLQPYMLRFSVHRKRLVPQIDIYIYIRFLSTMEGPCAFLLFVLAGFGKPLPCSKSRQLLEDILVFTIASAVASILCLGRAVSGF